MTKKIYYEKLGRRYVPVAEYDNDLLDSFTKGTHLVMSYPGGQSRCFNIDPNFYKNYRLKKCSSIKSIFLKTDLLIFHNNNKKFSKFNLKLFSNLMNKNSLIYDLWNNFSSKDLVLNNNVSYTGFGNLSNLKL